MFKLVIKFLWFKVLNFLRGQPRVPLDYNSTIDVDIGLLKCNIPKGRYFPTTFIPDSSMWGLDRHFKDLANKSIYFEHGIYFGDVILPTQRLAYVTTIVTQSPWRFRFLERTLTKKILLVHNYMYAVKTDESTAQERNKFALFFPAHSTQSTATTFSVSKAISEVRRLSEGIPIKIAIFHRDFTPELEQVILEQGASAVCFGSRYSPFFLENLKKTLLCASQVYTSDIGSHVGYSLAVGKVPVLISADDQAYAADEARWKAESTYYTDASSAEFQKRGVEAALQAHQENGGFSPAEERYLSDIFGLQE